MKNSLVWLKNRMCSLRCHFKIKYFQASFCIGRNVRLQWLLKGNHQISRFCSRKTWRLINKLLKIHQHLTKYCQTGALSFTGNFYPDYHFWRNGSGLPKISTKWIKFSPRLGDWVALRPFIIFCWVAFNMTNPQTCHFLKLKWLIRIAKINDVRE